MGFTEGIIHLRDQSYHLVVRVKTGEEAHRIEHIPKVPRRGNQRNTRGRFTVPMNDKHTLDLLS
jgi:hypothetical protein